MRETRCERSRRVISEVTGRGSRPAAVMALSEPGQCWTAGRLVGWLDDDDDGTGAWRTKWFVCYVAGAGAGAGACVSVSVCCRLSSFSGFLAFLAASPSVLCSVFDVFDVRGTSLSR